MVKHVEREFAGRVLKLEAGRLAKQAAGSCLLQFGETVVLATVTVSDSVSTLPFFPLTVEYREKSYAAGKIPGGFLKREGRPSDERSEEHTSELQSHSDLVCRLLPEKKKKNPDQFHSPSDSVRRPPVPLPGQRDRPGALHLGRFPCNQS